jgi:hypothetical protein
MLEALSKAYKAILLKDITYQFSPYAKDIQVGITKVGNTTPSRSFPNGVRRRFGVGRPLPRISQLATAYCQNIRGQLGENTGDLHAFSL